MPLQATSGAASYDAFGGGVPAVPNYIEDVFSTYLYTGNGSTQTITNGIDLATKGGLVWIKNRTQAASHYLQDTVRGANNYISTNNTNAQASLALNTVFNTDGFSQNNSYGGFNGSGDNYASWTFRKQPKFFDVVTYTGNGVAGRQIAHNLGSTPGCIIVKATSNTAEGLVYHQSLGNTKYLTLFSAANGTAAADTWTEAWNNTSPTSTHFTVGSGSNSNADGWTFVAYLFAHNAGGFGLTGTDNVISCGSYTGTSTTDLAVNLGYEPQWIMVKRTNSSASPGWWMGDIMRGFNMSGIARLEAQASDAESGLYDGIRPTSTGFVLPAGTVLNDSTSSTYIYIAIRRGPMKVPTSGASVFSPVAYTGNGAGASGQTITAGFPIDMASYRYINQPYGGSITDRLRGFTGTSSKALFTYLTNAEETSTDIYGGDSNTSIKSYGFSASYNFVGWYWRRAPSFFDVVCYTGNGTAQTINHNLGVSPELIIVKKRNSTSNWSVNRSSDLSKNISINLVTAQNSYTTYSSLTSTTVIFNSSGSGLTENGATYVMYLFATCPGVSKVGTYTGTGTTQTINCGFTGGARFVLIKRTDSTGGWYVWDTARGIVSGNDPYILLNNDLAQVTSTDYIDTYSAGFEISSTAPAAINASGGSFVFLAIA